jgi:heat shock protein HtpX
MSAAPTLHGTDFAAAIQRNKDNTLLLLEVLAVTAAVLGFVLGWAFGILRDIWAMSGWQVSHLTIGWVLRDLVRLPPRPEAFIGGVAMVAAGVGWGLATLRFGGQILAAFVGARPADPTNQVERRFLDAVEEMAIAAGLPTPRAMVVDTPALNAFASGSSPERAIITATAGLLQACTRDELQGVVGHEMGHVADYDVRYATVVAAVAGVAVLASHLLWDAGRWPWASRGRGGGNGGAARAGLTMAVMLVLAVVAIAAPLAARLVQYAISRQREYLADATSVKLTRNPIGLINALQRLQRSDTTLVRADSPVAALCIAAPGHDAAEELFSSHPPLEERIARLQNLGAATPSTGVA